MFMFYSYGQRGQEVSVVHRHNGDLINLHILQLYLWPPRLQGAFAAKA